MTSGQSNFHSPTPNSRLIQSAQPKLCNRGCALLFLVVLLGALSQSGCAGLTASSTPGNKATTNSAVSGTGAPVITTQPTSQAVNDGQAATFAVTASGAATLSYQWTKNSAAISGATLSTYTTGATTTSDSGAQFAVSISNSDGSVTSTSAVLTVKTAAGQLTPSVSGINFGNVSVGTSGSLNVTFTNSGTTNITISNVSIAGPGVAASGISTGQVLSGGQAVSLQVTFTPSAAGTLTGSSVKVTSTALNSPATVAISGAGVQATAHSVALSWAPETFIAGYNVYRSTISGGSLTKLNSALVSAADFVDTAVSSGQTYYYAVTAVDASNTESAFSTEVTAAIP